MLPDIAHTISIAASRERVWTVLTEAGLVAQWLGCIGFQARIGALFHMQPDPARRAAGDIQGATHCEMELLERPDRMRFSWFMPGTPKTHVEIVLSDGGNGTTLVRLDHTGWDRFAPDDVCAIRDMLDGGWSAFVLPGLKRLAESVPAA